MKKFINTFLSIILVVCCPFLTACSGAPDSDNQKLKKDINDYLSSLTSEYKQELMTSMSNLQKDSSA